MGNYILGKPNVLREQRGTQGRMSKRVIVKKMSAGERAGGKVRVNGERPALVAPLHIK